jgi:hypothetical protein
MPLSKIQGIEGQVTPNLGRRNLIINGAMQVNQRGTNSNITSGSANFGPDRYKFQINDLGTWELSQSTIVPSGQGFSNSLKLNCTTADTSVAAASYLLLQQRIEGAHLQHFNWGTSSAKNLTWSFWIRSTKTGTVSVEFQHQNTSGDYYTRSSTFTISASNTWEKKTITVPSNTAQDIKNHQGDGIYLSFWFTAGTDWTSGTFNTSTYSTGVSNTTRVSSSVPNHADSTNNEIYLTGIQLEVGDTATDFEHRSYAEELALCQRYFYRFTGHGTLFYADYYSNDTFITKEPLPVEMRVNPTVTTRGTGGSGNTAFSYTNLAATPTISASGKTSVAVYRGVASAARTYIHIYNTTAAYSVDASAEL